MGQTYRGFAPFSFLSSFTIVIAQCSNLKMIFKSCTTSSAIMRTLPLVAVVLGALAACSSSSSSDPGGPSGNDAGSTLDPFDVPLDGVTHDQFVRFNDGDTLFGLAMRTADGLGPLYTRDSCGGRHKDAARGPGIVQKMSVVEADGITAAPADQQQAKLPYGG